MPFFLDPYGPYAHIGQPPPRRRNKRKGLGLVVISLVTLVAGGIVAIIMQGGGTNPDTLFQTALANALSTNSYSKKSTFNQDDIQLKQDVTDVRAPRQSGTIDLVSLGPKLEGYSSIKNSYVRYTQFASSADPATGALLNKWEQVREAGKLPDSYTAGPGVESLFEARTSVMGDYIMGNFAESDRQTLISLVLAKGVYSYDASAVAPEDVDGQPVMRYDVKINGDGLRELNKKVGLIMGLPQDDINATVNKIDPSSLGKTTVKMYISTGTQRLIKVGLTQNNQTTSVLYSSFNSTVVANEPVADFQYAEFQALLTGKASTSLTGKARDSERQSDINSLASRIEAYYAANGFYPTLANLNDPAWLAANLKDARDSIFTDPEGTTKQLAAVPTPRQYAYQPFQDKVLTSCDGSTCKHFKLSATLVDGSVFSKSASN